MIVAIPSPYT